MGFAERLPLPCKAHQSCRTHTATATATATSRCATITHTLCIPITSTTTPDGHCPRSWSLRADGLGRKRRLLVALAVGAPGRHGAVLAARGGRCAAVAHRLGGVLWRCRASRSSLLAGEAESERSTAARPCADDWRKNPGWAAPVRAIVPRAISCPSVHMRPSRSSSLTALRASTARAAHGLARWLILVLLVVDQFSAPWHTHHHDSGVDGTALAAVRAAVHADGIQFERFAQAHAEAPDHRSTWVHATTVLRSEVGHALTRAGGDDEGSVSLWPADRSPPATKDSTRLAIASHHAPPTPAYRSLWPAPQAPPWRA